LHFNISDEKEENMYAILIIYNIIFNVTFSSQNKVLILCINNKVLIIKYVNYNHKITIINTYIKYLFIIKINSGIEYKNLWFYKLFKT